MHAREKENYAASIDGPCLFCVHTFRQRPLLCGFEVSTEIIVKKFERILTCQ